MITHTHAHAHTRPHTHTHTQRGKKWAKYIFTATMLTPYRNSHSLIHRKALQRGNTHTAHTSATAVLDVLLKKKAAAAAAAAAIISKQAVVQKKPAADPWWAV